MEMRCNHRRTEIIKVYRKNYPFGKKSIVRHYDPPRICIRKCVDCGKKLERWKPIR